MALSADIQTEVRGEWGQDYAGLAAGVKVYKGAQVSIDADGYLIPAADTASTRWAGIALETVDNTNGADGAVTCKYALPRGDARFKASGSGFQQTHVGQTAYISDDETISASNPGNAIVCGRFITYISATEMWVAARTFGNVN